MAAGPGELPAPRNVENSLERFIRHWAKNNITTEVVMCHQLLSWRQLTGESCRGVELG